MFNVNHCLLSLSSNFEPINGNTYFVIVHVETSSSDAQVEQSYQTNRIITAFFLGIFLASPFIFFLPFFPILFLSRSFFHQNIEISRVRNNPGSQQDW